LEFLKNTLAAVLVAVAFTSSGHAASLKDGGYVGCVSEEHLDQFITAAVSDDARAMDYLLNNMFCVPLSSQYQISVLDTGFTQVQFRLYVGNDAVDLWTVREAIQR
tara:strand:+ start:10125 stop:10442 length:318 start_codon:yes stop_codon:yes gene_type:complete